MSSNILQVVKQALRKAVPTADFKVITTKTKTETNSNGLVIKRDITAIEASYNNGTLNEANLTEKQIIQFIEQTILQAEPNSTIRKIKLTERTPENKGRAKPKEKLVPAAKGLYASNEEYFKKSKKDLSSLTLYYFDGTQWFKSGTIVPKNELPLDLKNFDMKPDFVFMKEPRELQHPLLVFVFKFDSHKHAYPSMLPQQPIPHQNTHGTSHHYHGYCYAP
jgi:hypothetical protein